jgi:hypothetical protein
LSVPGSASVATAPVASAPMVSAPVASAPPVLAPTVSALMAVGSAVTNFDAEVGGGV